MNRVENCIHEKNNGKLNTFLCDALSMILERQNLGSQIKLTGKNLTISKVHGICQTPAMDVSITEECARNVMLNYAYLKDKINSGAVVYGINTGFGGSADVRHNDTAKIQNTAIQHQNVGFGEMFDSSIVRGVMVIRANSLCRAKSGVRINLINILCNMLKADIIPIVPNRGSVSASGDLMPTSYIGAAMVGRVDSKVLHHGKVKLGPQALQDANLTPVTFIHKDALALINAFSFSDCLASCVLYQSTTAALLTQITVAMSLEALCGKTESFHPTIHQCLPHSGQIEVAENILRLSQGSKLAQTKLDMECLDKDGCLKQDRYPLRTAAQWLGPAMDLIHRAIKCITININSTNDNPIIDHLNEKILHGGNFQGTSTAVAMDNTRQALQLCGKILYAQMSEIINKDLNKGLPPNLSGCDYTCDFGFKGMDIAMSAYMSELDLLTSPVTRHVLSAEINNQSVNSLALLSARWTEKALTVLHYMLTNILVCQVQAIDLRWLQKKMTHKIEELCQKYNVDYSCIHPKIWTWYDFAFYPVATLKKLTDTFPNFTIGTNFVRDMEEEATCLLNTIYAGKHVYLVEQMLGQGTAKMYKYIREKLGIKFHHGQKPLDTDLQELYNAITNRDIESCLLDSFSSDFDSHIFYSR